MQTEVYRSRNTDFPDGLEPGFRHELKYICSDAELAALEIRLRTVMRTDPHADARGIYRIRSM